MAPTDFDIALEKPRLRGRAAKPVSVDYVRDLTESDFALLNGERGIASSPVIRLRERHHLAARCLAQGMSPGQTAAVTGYDPSRISILSADPSFKELVAQYRTVEDGALADFMTRAGVMTLSAMNRIQEALEDDESPVSVPLALEVFKAGADRIGHAPVQKNVNLNANFEVGDRLEKARARLAARSKSVIEGDSNE